jgi:hypothetical protein
MAIDLPPTIWTPPKPAIIQALPAPFRVRIGEQHGASEIEYHEWAFPRDIREASLAEARAYMPKDLDFDFPEWALQRLLPKMGMFVPGVLWNLSVPLVKTVVFLTTTNAADQSWSVLDDWNSADNNVEVIAPGGSGGGRRGGTSSSTNSNASGGGGGAYSGQTNITLTPSGSATYRLPAGGASHNVSGLGTATPGNTGADAWFNSTSLAGSSVGAKGGAGGSAATNSATGAAGGAAGSGIGATKTSGGGSATSANSGAGASGGGGAGGPTSNGVSSSGATGGNGGSPSGGTGSSASNAGGDGTGWQVSPARGSGGGSGGDTSQVGGASAQSGAGGNFGGGSGGCASRQTSGSPGSALIGAGGPALIVITNNFTL